MRVDLDTLERDALAAPPNWEDHAPDPAEVAALVRAVRAAQALLPADPSAVVSTTPGRAEKYMVLAAALEPFRKDAA